MSVGNAEELFAAAYEHYQRHRYEEALEKLDASLKQYPLKKAFLLLTQLRVARNESLKAYEAVMQGLRPYYADEDLRGLARSMEQILFPLKPRSGDEEFVAEAERDGRYVNIAMVTYNRLDYTRQAIESLKKHTRYPYRLTVADNASTDGTREYLLSRQADGVIDEVILFSENQGLSRAGNAVWLLDDAPYYLRIDNDLVICKDYWLADLVRVCEAIPDVGVVGYNVEPFTYPLQIVNSRRVRVKNGNVGGGCIMVPRSTHERLGFWCEDYGVYGEEDLDYNVRCDLSGLRNFYMDDEDALFHLPAGKAALINMATCEARDGKEEHLQKEYRNFKDEQRRIAVQRFKENLRNYKDGGITLNYITPLHRIGGLEMLEYVRQRPQRLDAIAKITRCMREGRVDSALDCVARELGDLPIREEIVREVSKVTG
jgi:glycosyltransferase involved in cell wall biosynthesis